MATRANTPRSIRNMVARLARSGVTLTDGGWAAEILAAPADRASMHAAAAAVAARVSQGGQQCTKEAVLEAAAALRGFRDWNALAAQLPAAAGHMAVDQAGVRSTKQQELTRNQVLVLDERSRLTRLEVSDDPNFTSSYASRVPVMRFGTYADTQAKAAAILADISAGRLDGRGTRYVTTLLAAISAKPPPTWAFDHPPLEPQSDPIVGPLILRLANNCRNVDEASAAIREAADKQQQIAETHPARLASENSLYGEYVAACLLMGGLRTADANIWRLDADELRENRERREARP
jgi:hypothetical protein